MRTHEPFQTKLDTLAALVMAESAANGPPTNQAVSVISLALDIAKNRVFKAQEIQALQSVVDRLSLMGNWSEVMERFCDTSFLYPHRAIIPAYFESIMKNKEEAYRQEFLI